MAGEESAAPGPGSARPTVAGIYDYLLGGTDNSAADRALGDQIVAELPDVQVGVQASYVFIHHLLAATNSAAAGLQAALQRGLGRVQFRTRTQVQELFAGLELVEPGVVPVPEWRPDLDTPSARDWPVLQLACADLARKP